MAKNKLCIILVVRSITEAGSGEQPSISALAYSPSLIWPPGCPRFADRQRPVRLNDAHCPARCPAAEPIWKEDTVASLPHGLPRLKGVF